MKAVLVWFGLSTWMLITVEAADFGVRFDTLKRAAKPAQLYALLYDLPKGGDLHNHAWGANLPAWTWAVLTDPTRTGGDAFYTRLRFNNCPASVMPFVKFTTIRRQTYEALSPCAREEYAALTDLAPADREAWKSSLMLDRPGEGRDEFFNVSIWTRLNDVARNPQVRFELLVENLKAFGAEKVRYVETQFDVDGLADNNGLAIPEEDGLALLRTRLAQSDVAATGVVVRFQKTILRFAPAAEQSLRSSYAFVDAHRDLWVGLNMAGIEENGHGFPRRFLETFRELRREYPTLPLSIHAGEMDGPDQHVRDTLLLGATRIGHGVNLIHDEDTLLLLQQSRRVLVEINLISNRLLEYTPDLAKHPFPEYLRTGVPVCLNTDDRGMWDSNMTDEYFTAVATFHLSWSELVELGRNSLIYSFVQPDVKARLLANYERDVAAFVAKYEAGRVEDALATLEKVRPVAYGYAKRTWDFEF
jgi:adenosine deaminase CECR1